MHEKIVWNLKKYNSVVVKWSNFVFGGTKIYILNSVGVHCLIRVCRVASKVVSNYIVAPAVVEWGAMRVCTSWAEWLIDWHELVPILPCTDKPPKRAYRCHSYLLPFRDQLIPDTNAFLKT